MRHKKTPRKSNEGVPKEDSPLTAPMLPVKPMTPAESWNNYY